MSIDVAQTLLARAGQDAEAVRATLDIGAVTDSIVGFLAQQATEKSLKAVLVANDIDFPFTHDLEGLVERGLSQGVEIPSSLVESAGLLTPYAVRHRYGAEPASLLSRETALLLAETAVSWATKQLDDRASD